MTVTSGETDLASIRAGQAAVLGDKCLNIYECAATLAGLGNGPPPPTVCPIHPKDLEYSITSGGIHPSDRPVAKLEEALTLICGPQFPFDLQEAFTGNANKNATSSPIGFPYLHNNNPTNPKRTS